MKKFILVLVAYSLDYVRRLKVNHIFDVTWNRIGANYKFLSNPVIQPTKNMVAELRRKEYIQQENIKDLFLRTIYSKKVIEKTYDYCLTRLTTHSKKKHDFYTLHKRAYLLTLKLLSK